MEDLLCDETWLSRSVNAHDYDHDVAPFEHENNQEFEQAFIVSLEKEISLMPEPNYAHFLRSNHLLSSRFRVIQWFLKCRSLFDLSFGTVFYAVNYLDRFLSICRCNDWKYWMVELLSITCLSIAIKFNEISALSLHEIQVEGLEYSYESKTVLRMEMTVLKALGWRLNTVTPYSIVEMVASNIQSFTSHHLHHSLLSPVTHLLLQATLDEKMLDFRQSTVGISALWWSVDQLYPQISNTFIAYIIGLFNQSQKDDLFKCHEIMGVTTSFVGCGHYYYYPSSPTTVLLKE